MEIEENVLEFVDYHFNEEPKYTIDEAKARNTTYATRLQVKVRLIKQRNWRSKRARNLYGRFSCDD